MVRLRNVVMGIVLCTGLAGCSFAHWSIWHCDTCDDFPTPAYGPGYSMMPGTYTGPPTLNSSGSGGPAGSTPPAAGAAAPAAPAATATPPTPPNP
jgi:hypothetical protein